MLPSTAFSASSLWGGVRPNGAASPPCRLEPFPLLSRPFSLTANLEKKWPTFPSIDPLDANLPPLSKSGNSPELGRAVDLAGVYPARKKARPTRSGRAQYIL
ncbi:MAG: hypothetical protein Kow0040_02730 [Thermogutta sp.]